MGDGRLAVVAVDNDVDWQEGHLPDGHDEIEDDGYADRVAYAYAEDNPFPRACFTRDPGCPRWFVSLEGETGPLEERLREELPAEDEFWLVSVVFDRPPRDVAEAGSALTAWLDAGAGRG